MADSRYHRRSINLDDASFWRCKQLAQSMSLSVSAFLRVLIHDAWYCQDLRNRPNAPRPELFRSDTSGEN
jgi:hypothetical protein